MSILASVAVPSFVGYVERAKKEVCSINCLQLERMYQTYLLMEHTQVIFAQYLQEFGEKICPNEGEIGYFDEKVLCSVHPRDDIGDDEEYGSVTFL